MSDASDAAAKAAQMYYAVYDETRRNLKPYGEVGTSAINPYAWAMNLPGYAKPEGYDLGKTLSETPYYNALMDTGIDAIDRSAASRGMLGSGAVAKGLMKFGQNNVMTPVYSDYMGRLNDLLKFGQDTYTKQGNAGMQFAQGAGNALMDAAKTDSLIEAQQPKNSLFSSIMGGAGLLGGALLSPMPQGGFKNTIGGGFYNWIRG